MAQNGHIIQPGTSSHNGHVVAPIDSFQTTHQIELSTFASNMSPRVLPSDEGNAVRTLEISEYKEAAACLAESFKDDEVARYFVDTGDRKDWDEAEYWNLHVLILECIVRAHILKGLATTVGHGYGCVALWWV